MPEDTLMVFTYRSKQSILEERGAQAWVLDPVRARRCSYIVCTRNRSFPDADLAKQEGATEPHGAAFLIGRITTVERSPEIPGRYIVRFDKYATLTSQEVTWPGSQNPVRYVKDINKLGIRPHTLEWRPVIPQHDLQRLISEAQNARACFRVWRTLDWSKGEPTRRQAMDDWTYVDFFHVTMWGTLTLAFLSLGKIFDRSPSALSLRDATRGLHDSELIRKVDDLYEKQRDAIEKIERIRDKSVAHNDRLTGERKLFEEVGITPNEMENLIDDVAGVLNAAAEQVASLHRVPDDLRFKKAVHSLLDKLGNR